MSNEIIFLGNGPLADYALAVLEKQYQVIFRARSKADLAKVQELKAQYPKAHGVLASYGVLIKSDVLEQFEPEGILNIHPSLLPKYRGATPIETAILNGETKFGVSVMKLVKAMDAGPIYYQTTKRYNRDTAKDEIYRGLAEAGAKWLAQNLNKLPEPRPQDDAQATFTAKLEKAQGQLDPDRFSAAELHDQVRAYVRFPKSKYNFYGLECIIHQTHVATEQEMSTGESRLALRCKDGKYLVIDQIQPAGKKVMDRVAFLNGYDR